MNPVGGQPGRYTLWSSNVPSDMASMHKAAQHYCSEIEAGRDPEWPTIEGMVWLNHMRRDAPVFMERDVNARQGDLQHDL